MKYKILCFGLILSFQIILKAQSFDLVPLGVHGGGEENNLSAYLLSEKDKNEYLALDAGTLRYGIDKAIENGIFKESNIDVLKNKIKGYFISHGHLDHLAGLIINSPDDSSKNIYGLSSTLDVLKNNYFTNNAWINFANEGDQPQLKKYTYQRKDQEEVFDIAGTALQGKIFKLSHVAPLLSSAILVTTSKGDAILYLGDTGADRVEKSNYLQHLWKSIAPFLQNKKIKALLIEVSFENNRSETQLFGHLTPRLLFEELSKLENISGKGSLNGLKIVVTHLKPVGNQIEKIKEELFQENTLGVELIFPAQGEKIVL